MAAKGHSIIYCKCPRCHEGDLFLSSNPYSFSQFLLMPDCCSVCKQDFVIEPGFYLGAMWISYPFVILLEILFIVLGVYGFGMDILWALGFSSFCLMLLLPPLIRYSRSVWIHLFV